MSDSELPWHAAGGIAHDFSNLMTVVLSASDMLRRDPGDAYLLETIMLAASRAQELTKQLVELGRRDPALTRLSINDCVREALQLCSGLFPPTVQVRLSLAEEPWPVLGNATQTLQLLMNLLTNARDALPDGGIVTVETANISVRTIPARDGSDASSDPGSGDYMRLTVRDTGLGMDADTRERMFEAFYTAKTHGTGLGLFMVHTIATRMRGHVLVESSPARGTRFEIYLPRVLAEAET